MKKYKIKKSNSKFFIYIFLCPYFIYFYIFYLYFTASNNSCAVYVTLGNFSERFNERKKEKKNCLASI